MPIIKKPFSLSPLNDNPAVLTGNADTISVSGGFSHRQGFPTIKFSIPPQPSMLEMSSLRLVGQILVKKSNNQIFVANRKGTNYSNGVTGNTNGVVGNIELENANMLPQTALNLPNWGGVKNVLDKVVVQSKKSLIELTSVNNYGQYAGMTECYNNNGDDYLIGPLTNSLSGGGLAKHINRRLLTAATAVGDTNIQTNGTVAQADQGSGFGSLRGGANDRMVGQFFSIPIQIDLLGAQNLFLDDDYLGGLLITLHLNSDAAVFHNRFALSNGTHAAPNDMSSNSYVLKNVKLEGRYLVPDANDMASVPSQLSLDSRLNLINDVHSSVNANAYTPQLQSVKSIVNVFLDNDQTNTYTKNSNNFRHLPGEKSFLQARNGLRFPQNFEVFNKPNFESVPDKGTGTHGAKTLHFPALEMGDSETRMNFAKSLLNGGLPYHSSSGLGSTNNRLVEDNVETAAADSAVSDNCVADCIGVGCDYTLGVGITQNFVNQDYNLTVKSGVNTANALLSKARNGDTTANPLLEQSFVRYNSMFDTQNLVKII
jgi:hypothetical protein